MFKIVRWNLLYFLIGAPISGRCETYCTYFSSLNYMFGLQECGLQWYTLYWITKTRLHPILRHAQTLVWQLFIQELKFLASLSISPPGWYALKNTPLSCNACLLLPSEKHLLITQTVMEKLYKLSMLRDMRWLCYFM